MITSLIAPSDVAQRAGSGLGARYRRWPTKRDLVHAALELVAGTPPV